MAFIIILISSIVLCFCLSNQKGKKGLLYSLLAILFMPIGIIFSISKKYK